MKIKYKTAVTGRDAANAASPKRDIKTRDFHHICIFKLPQP